MLGGSRVLFYPNYTPSRSELRSILLYYDSLSTIVPAADQANVLDRDHVRELSTFEPDIYQPIDPGFDYFRWISHSFNMERFMDIVRIEEARSRKIPELMERHLTEVFIFDRSREKWFEKMKKNSWSFMAAQKIPPDILDMLVERRVGLDAGYLMNLDGKVVETKAFFLPNSLKNFLMCRLAREVSQDLRISPFSMDAGYFRDQLIDEAVSQREIESILLTASIPLVAAKDIDGIDAEEYMDIRRKFEPVRKNLANYMHEFSANARIGDYRSAKEMAENLRDLRQILKEKVDLAEEYMKNNRRKNTIRISVNFVLTVSAAAIGGWLGDSTSSAVAAGITYLGSEYANKYTTIGYNNISKFEDSLVSIRADIERYGRKNTLIEPNFII